MKRKNVILMIAIMLLSVTMAFGQWNIDEGFEGGIIPAGWTVYDVNGDGYEWVAYENASAAHSGDWVAAVECYGSDGEDWLITPQVTIQSGDFFIFFIKAWFGTEDFNVKLSTTGNSISNFNVTLESVTGLGDDYVEYSYDLSSYAGSDIYLAIEWDQDTYALVVDDVKVGQEAPVVPEAPENVLILINNDDVQISWSQSANATDYKVEYSSNPYNGYEELTSTTGGATSYTHTNGTVGVKYFYRVIAMN